MQSLVAQFIVRLIIGMLAATLGAGAVLAASPVKPKVYTPPASNLGSTSQDSGSIILIAKKGSAAGYMDNIQSLLGPSSSDAIPSNALPASALPASALPASALPASGIPSNALPSNAIPSNAIPSNGIPSNYKPMRVMNTGIQPSAPSFGELICLQSQGCQENTRYEGYMNPVTGSEMVYAPSTGAEQPPPAQVVATTAVPQVITNPTTLDITITVPPPLPASNEVFVIPSENTYCRTGPGTVYPAVTTILSGQQVRATARHPATNYYVLLNPNASGECWLWGQKVVVTGPVESLPIAVAPPAPVTVTPTATPTPIPITIFIKNNNPVGGNLLMDVYFRLSGSSKWTQDKLSTHILSTESMAFSLNQPGVYDIKVNFCNEGTCWEVQKPSITLSDGTTVGFKYP